MATVKKILDEGIASYKEEQAASNQKANEVDAAERKKNHEEAMAKSEAAMAAQNELSAANEALREAQEEETKTQFNERFQQITGTLDRMSTKAAEQQEKSDEEASEMRKAQTTAAAAQGELANMFTTLMGRGAAQPLLRQANIEETGVACGGDVDEDEEAAAAKARV